MKLTALGRSPEVFSTFLAEAQAPASPASPHSAGRPAPREGTLQRGVARLAKRSVPPRKCATTRWRTTCRAGGDCACADARGVR